MIGEYKKTILFIMIIFVGLTPFGALLAENSDTGVLQPPTPEDIKSFAKTAATTTKSFLGGFNDFWRRNIAPFFVKISRKINEWWNKVGRVWFLSIWQKFLLLLEKEISIK
jgi:hypothetical protein